MKVEVELSEIEHLKREISRLQAERNELRSKLKDLSEEEIKERIDEQAMIMLDSLMHRIFEDIGFEPYDGRAVTFTDMPKLTLERNVDRILWYKHERLQITLGAEITQQFQRAYLNMGVKPLKREND